jgi:hypothetical protein
MRLAGKLQAERQELDACSFTAASRCRSTFLAGLDHLEPFGAPSIFAHGSFTMFAAMRRASSRVSSLAADRLPTPPRNRRRRAAVPRNGATNERRHFLLAPS